MSTRIAIDVAQHPYEELAKAGIREARSLRVLVQVGVYNPEIEATEYFGAWVDTGSPYTLLPAWAWEGRDHIVLAPGVPAPLIGGSIKADFAAVSVMFVDERTSTNWRTVQAFCCHTDDFHPLIGMDALEESLLVCHVGARDGYIAFPF